MTGTVTRRIAAALMCACAAGLVLGSAVAQAAIGHQYLSQLTGFSVPGSVAVDDASGLTLVPDSGSETIDVFNSSGQPVATWDGSAANNAPGTPKGTFAGALNVAANNATGDVYVSESGNNVVDILSSTGAYLGQLTGVTFSSAGPLAVDQATGNVYVADVGVGVDVFDSAGAFTGALPSYACGFGCNVAVDDQDGTVLVADDQTDVVNVFDAATSAYATTWTGSGTPAGSFGTQLVWVAADNTTGHVYVSDSGNNVVDELDSSGNYLDQITGAGTPPSGGFGRAYGVGVGQASGDVYVGDPGDGVVDVFGPDGPDAVTAPASSVGPTSATLNGTVNPNGATISDCHFAYVDAAHYNSATANPYAGGGTAACASTPVGSSPVAVSAPITGLAAGTTYDVELYATVSGGGTTPAGNVSFQTPPPPAIDSASATNVTPSSATLNAQINPEGLDTTCQFQWGTSTSYGTTVPCNPADIGSGTTDASVSQQLTGLSANTEYHWRVVATNAAGTTVGGDHTFNYITTTGGALPDGRGYELVSPVNKNDALLLGGFVQPAIAASDGDHLLAGSPGCFADTPGCTATRDIVEGVSYLFSRTPAGWVPTALAPPAALVSGARVSGGSPDAGVELYAAGTPPAGEDDWYLSRADGSTVDIGPVYPPADGSRGPGTENKQSWSADFSHLVYTLYPVGWPGGGQGDSTYEYAGTGNSRPQLVGVTGDAGSTNLISACGTTLGSPSSDHNGAAAEPGAVSADGQTVFFTALGADDNLTSGCSQPEPPVDEAWARIGSSRSVELSARSPSDCTTSACLGSAPEPADFRGASDDGSKAFFVSSQQLTDSAVQGSGNLYEYDFASPRGHELIDVSAGDTSGHGPGVGAVIAVSADGSHVYFEAAGVLSSVANSASAFAEPGADNLYVYERDSTYPGGHLAFIGGLSPYDGVLGGSSPLASFSYTEANVTPDGRFLVLASHNDLTADDTSQTAAAQVFRYDAQTGRLMRVSIGAGGFNDDGNAGGSSLCAGQQANGCTADAAIAAGRQGGRRDASMSDDGGRVFFQSPVGLTPQALNVVAVGTNGTGYTAYAENVYEWEQPGSGSCPAASSAGCVYLISDGKDTASFAGVASDVELLGADGTGDDVFFSTSDQLVPQDTDTELEVYDARVGGGFPYTPPQQCTGDTCQGAPGTVPGLPRGGTVTFTGSGDAVVAGSGGTVKVITRAVRGTTFSISVRVPGAGRVSIAGARIRTVRRSVPRAGTYGLNVALTAAAKRALARKHPLRLSLRVAYDPVDGRASTVSLQETVRLALPRLTLHPSRRAGARSRGGAR